MSRWTFIAQRATTGEFLDWDVPLELDALEWELSGPGSLSATVAPDVGGLRADDGRLLLEEWGTLIYAESDGEIRWGGILISSTFQGEEWKVEAAGFTTYPHSIIYRGEFYRVGIDPAEVIRHIWEHIQLFPDSDLGVTVTGDSTPIRVGTPGTPPVPNDAGVLSPPADKIKAAEDIADRLESGDPIFEDWTWENCPQIVADFNGQLQNEWNRSLPAAAWLRSYIETNPAVEEEGYALLWWESPNCGDEIADLITTTPLDYAERHRWSEDKETIVHEVALGYPRLGRRREDIAFVQGDNVTSAVVVESIGDDFANTVRGLGAGEGQAMLLRETSVRDGRLRRDAVYTAKDVTTAARLDALIAEELNARKAALRITSLDVVDHPNARIGAWQLGDDVLVRAEVPWLGEIEVWVRITGWALTGEDTATLTVSRSDLFRYGG